MYTCAKYDDFVSVYDFPIGFSKCYDGVLFIYVVFFWRGRKRGG